ncbi:MAG: efflux RND transporter permease subunit [Propionibacteriaceae bacterium]|jgi:HAE1 family hydrophobic/amphiphilic exporter-1|nr:efflux RND transporter permease subunit [Propionibacteriaceae bacterium]
MGTSVFKLASSSLRHRAVVFLLTLAVVAAGLYSAWTLKRQLMPELSLNTVAVVLDYPGAAPELVCRQLTGPVEAALDDLPDVVGVTSTASTGRSVSLVEFAAGTDLDWARQRLATLVTGLAAGWPGQVTSQFSILSADDQPDAQVAVIGLEADLPDLGRVAQITRDLLLPLIGHLDQVRSVSLSGGVSNVIKLTLRPEAMARYGVGADQIMAVLRDFGLSWPAGSLNTGEQTVAVQAGSPITSLDELRAIPVRVIAPAPPTTDPNRPSASPNPAGPTVVTLEMVAETALEPAPTESRARVNGNPAVVATVLKTNSSDALELSQALAETIRQINPALAQNGLMAQLVFDRSPFLERSSGWLSRAGLIGLAACLLVVLAGLPSLRSSLVAAVAIPTAWLGGLIVLRLTGSSLNIMTVAALAVALGRLWDDSIVVLENIKRHLAYGQPKPAAIVRAVREVAGGITAATAATAALFLPLAGLPGLAGQSIRPFVWTLTAALASSLLVALTVVPALCHWLLKSTLSLDADDADRRRRQVDARRRERFGQRFYAVLLQPALRHPVVVLLLATLALGGTAWFSRQLEVDPQGPGDRDTLQIIQVFPSDSALPVQDAQAGRIENVLLQLDFVRTVQTTVGGPADPTPLNPGGQPQASFSVTVRSEAVADAPERIRRALSGLSAQIGQVSVLEPAWRRIDSTVDLVVRALDKDSLAVGLSQVEAMAQGLDRAGAVTGPETGSLDLIQVTVDRQRAMAAGLTETQVDALVAAAVQPSRIGALTSGNDLIDVLVAAGQAPATIDDLVGLPLGNGPTGPLKLGDLATVETVRTPALITTDRGQRTATVSLDPAPTDLIALTGQLDQALDRLRPDLPPGVTVEITGLTAPSDNPLVEAGLIGLLALGLAYIVLVAALGGPLRAVVPLLAIPAVAVGGGAGLLIGGAPLGWPALIGLLALSGVTVSNTMVLIGSIDQARSAGGDLDEAVLTGARQRLRPVLLTAGSIALAVAPLLIGLPGSGSTSLRPLASAVLGGLVVSTLFSLIVAPACQRLLARSQDRRQDRREARRLRQLDKLRNDRSSELDSDQPEGPDGQEESTVVIRRRARRSRSADPAGGQSAQRPASPLDWEPAPDRPPNGTDQASSDLLPSQRGAAPSRTPPPPAPFSGLPPSQRGAAGSTPFEPLDRLGGGFWRTPPERSGAPDHYDRPDPFGLERSRPDRLSPDTNPSVPLAQPALPPPADHPSPYGGSGSVTPTTWPDRPTPGWTGSIGSIGPAGYTGSADPIRSSQPTPTAGSAGPAGTTGSAGSVGSIGSIGSIGPTWSSQSTPATGPTGTSRWSDGLRPGDRSAYLDDWRSAGPPRPQPEPDN